VRVLFEKLKSIFSSFSEKVKSSLGLPSKVDRGFVERSVQYWNMQKFSVSKYGYQTKPKTVDMRKIADDKKPSVKAYRPVRSRVDKSLLTVVQICGRDKVTGKKKKFTVTLAHDKLMSVKQIKKEAMKQANRLARNPDIPEEYDISIEEIVPLIGYLNVEALSEYQDVIDELNPAYFE